MCTRKNRGEPFAPHPRLSDQINHNIIQSELEGGVFLYELPVGSGLQVETQNRFYNIEHLGIKKDSSGSDHYTCLISGHPEFCPEPVEVEIYGSIWGGSMIKLHFIGRGMRLEFRHQELGVIWTSSIKEITQIS